MKKLLIVFLIALMVPMLAFAEIDFSEMTDDDLRLLRADIDTELSARQAARALESGTMAEGNVGEFHVALMSATLSKDYQGKPAIATTYYFTNNSEETKAFWLAVSVKAFQNGIELERGMMVDNVDTTNNMLDLRPGAAIETQIGFLLNHETAPVEIEITKAFDWSNNPDKIVCTFDITK